MATSHFHLDGNKVYKSSTQQALVKLILRHRTLNGLAGRIEFYNFGQYGQRKKSSEKLCHIETRPPSNGAFICEIRTLHPGQICLMKYEAKAYVNELNALKKATVGSSGSKHPLNSASKDNRLKKRSRDDFCENVDDTNYNMPMRNRPPTFF